MAKQADKFQSILVHYPKRLYLPVLRLSVSGDTLIFPYILNRSLKQTRVYSETLIEEVQKTYGQDHVSSSVQVLPFSFSRDYPLKKEYWANPSVNIDPTARAGNFTNAMRFHELYELLVVPNFNLDSKKRVVEYTAGVAVKKHCEHEIETFMYASTLPVSEEAKNAALYNFDKPLFYNIVNNEKFSGKPN